MMDKTTRLLKYGKFLGCYEKFVKYENIYS